MRDKTRIYGLDLSKKTYVGCCLSGEGFTKRFLFNGDMTAEGRTSLAVRLKETDILAMEGGTSTFTLARFLMERTEARIVVLNPGKLHVIFESMCKTDKQDAIKLATYLRDVNEEAWCTIKVPSQAESDYRSVITTSIFYVQNRVSYINRLHAVFNQNGHPELKKSDLKTKGRRDEFVSRYLAGTCLDIAMMLCESIDLVESRIADLEGGMRAICAENPALARSWLSLPGIGLKTAASLIAYLGDLSRFQTPDQLKNYVGLIPKKDQSGNQDKHLGVRWAGCMPIRRNIVQAGWAVMKFSRDCSLTEYYGQMRLRGKKGQKAAVALANKLLDIGFALAKKKEIYSFEDNEAYTKKKLTSYRLGSVWQECTTIPATEDSKTS